jgi:hypothetical protein
MWFDNRRECDTLAMKKKNINKMKKKELNETSLSILNG